jgi:hypothetical protein
MTQTAPPRTYFRSPAAARTDTDSFEVTTVGADLMRATIRTAGALTLPASAALIGMLRAHLRAGRRYLRVDVGGSRVVDPAVLASLTSAHRQVAACGGMLVFENAGPQVVDAIRNSDLFVQAAY